MILKKGYRYLITEKDRPLRAGHSDFEQRRGLSPGYLVFLNVLEECAIWATDGRKNNKFYSDEENGKQCNSIKMEEVGLLRECVLFGTGHLRHASGGWKENYSLRHQLFLIPEYVVLKGPVAFVYGDSIPCDVHSKRQALLGDVAYLYLSDEEESVDNNISGKMVTVEMTEEAEKIVLSI